MWGRQRDGQGGRRRRGFVAAVAPVLIDGQPAWTRAEDSSEARSSLPEACVLGLWTYRRPRGQTQEDRSRARQTSVSLLEMFQG